METKVDKIMEAAQGCRVGKGQWEPRKEESRVWILSHDQRCPINIHWMSDWTTVCLECLMSRFSNVKDPIQCISIIEKHVTLIVFGVTWKFLSQKVKANKTGLLLEGIPKVIFLIQDDVTFTHSFPLSLKLMLLRRTYASIHFHESWMRADTGPILWSVLKQADRLSDSSTRKDVKNLNFKKETEKPSRVLKIWLSDNFTGKHMGVGAWMTLSSFIMENR